MRRISRKPTRVLLLAVLYGAGGCASSARAAGGQPVVEVDAPVEVRDASHAHVDLTGTWATGEAGEQDDCIPVP